MCIYIGAPSLSYQESYLERIATSYILMDELSAALTPTMITTIHPRVRTDTYDDNGNTYVGM